MITFGERSTVNGLVGNTIYLQFISGFHIFKFFHSLKFIFNPQINTHSVFVVICKNAHSGEKFELPNTHLPSFSSSDMVNNYYFHGLVNVM